MRSSSETGLGDAYEAGVVTFPRGEMGRRVFPVQRQYGPTIERLQQRQGCVDGRARRRRREPE